MMLTTSLAEWPIFLYIGICLVLFGFLSAVQDRLRDGDLKWTWLKWQQGNVRYFWQKDPWHLAKSLKQSCMYLALAIALYPHLPWWGYLVAVFIVMPGLVGRTFSLFYHTLLKGTPDQTWWGWIQGMWNWKTYR